MDPRLVMAETLKMLGKAGMDSAEYMAEVNNCEGPDDAIAISYQWQAIAEGEMEDED